MIELKKLRKVYNSRKGGSCVALKGIDLQLPDTGLVFIIGKSGSGKSTLLNLLGGLDTITSGDIIADGNSLSSFSESDFENYRNSYIGFIFQHYYLLEELTVKENVELAMGIAGMDDSDRVEELLEKVGLSGYEDRYPKELSGGQQQRVAIARALAKDPKLILGDELTGNLDHNTSVDILNVLKEISKEKLVVVVSHNLDEADLFADRIIELHDGQIYRDRSRIKTSQHKFSIKGNVAYLPYFRDLTPEETKILDAGLRTGRIKDIVQRDDGFVMTTHPKNTDKSIFLPRIRFVDKRKIQYTGIFTRKGFLTRLKTIVLVTLMILCVSVFSSMHKIQHNEVPYDTSESYVPLVKGGLENPTSGIFSAGLYRVIPDDIKKAETLSGAGVYELVNVTLVTSPNGGSSTAGGTQADLRRNFGGFYIYETYGTLVCDEQFLIEKYGVDGKIVYAEGTVGDPYSKLRGVTIITDYVADALIKFQPDRYPDYQAIIDSERAIAIVETGYEERYAKIIERYDNYTGSDYESLYLELCRTEPLFEEYLREVIYSLGISYTFNEDFVQTIIDNPSRKSGTLRNVSFERVGEGYKEGAKTNVSISYTTSQSGSSYTESYYVGRGQVKMGYSTYNSIFGTGYTLANYKEFTPHTVTMRIYDRKIDGAVKLYEMPLEITALTQSTGMRMNKVDFTIIKKYTLQTFGLYVRNNENIEATVSGMAEDIIAPRSIAFDAIAGINKILTVFIPLLRLISAGLYVFIVIYLINHSMQIIKKNYFQIGVMRAFGAKNTDIGIIFITGVVLTGLIISVLSVALEPLIIELYNTILVESFAVVLNTCAFDIRVINMPAWLPYLNSAMVILITLITALVSLRVLKNLKPIEIIRAKDNGGEVS